MPKPLIHRAPQPAEFRSDGPRAFFSYADLGLATETAGKFGAHIVRANRAVRPGDGTGWHVHEADFQLIYVIRGQAVLNYEGAGRQTLKAGDAVYQPRGLKHDVVEVSEDYEHLEIDMPASFETIQAK